MSREILFKYVIERDGIKHLSREYELGEDGLPSHEDVLEDMEGECTCDLNESNPCCDGSCVEWEGATVVGKLQYTGLKDKKGVEIYEGDVIETKHGLYPVIWSDELSRFCASCQMVTLSPWNWNIHKVIGNIHEKPELLTQSK